MIDFHAHILPGADHGCSSVDEAEEQLKLLADCGVDTVVAAPHFHPKYMTVEQFNRTRRACVQNLADARIPRDMRILIGAEVTVTDAAASLAGLSDLAVPGTDVLLCEMPEEEWSDKLIGALVELRAAGLRPILAHVDRYPAKDVEALFELGFRGQLNFSAVAGAGLFKRRKFLRWIDNAAIVALGSDLHGHTPESAAAIVKAAAILGEARIARVEARTRSMLRGARSL